MDADGGTAQRWDFFVSYTGVDRDWAEWVAWQLEDAGYQVLVQAWDMVAGSNWAVRMQDGIARADRTIALLSAAYLASVYGQAEWQAAQAADPRGFKRKLVPIRIADCPRPGLLGQIVSFDLFSLDQDHARDRLLKEIGASRTGRAKPGIPPHFPLPPAARVTADGSTWAQPHDRLVDPALPAGGIIHRTYVLSNDVLLDNSTYFSAMRAIRERVLDSYSVYNLGILLECLVVAERVFSSPTLAWTPGTDDSLFTASGPFMQLHFEDWTSSELSNIFAEAVSESARDVSRSVVWQSLGCEHQDIEPARRLLRDWHAEAMNDPLKFAEQYSGAVYLTDTGSKRTVAGLGTKVGESLPQAHHLAQYLLRTNVALELAKYRAYHPHSHRLFYVQERIGRASREAATLGQVLLSATEAQIESEIRTRRESSVLARFGAFAHEAQLPLVLAAVLTQASTPDEIIPIALSIRGRRSARRYREWTGKFLNTIEDGDFARQVEAEAELEDARRLLFDELRALFRPRDTLTGILETTGTITAAVDPKSIAGIPTWDRNVAEGVKAATFPQAASRIQERRTRRNLVFLLDLARERQDITALNSRLKPIFGQGLGEDELEKFYRLQKEHRQRRAAIATLAINPREEE